MRKKNKVILSVLICSVFLLHCKDGNNEEQPIDTDSTFYFGADLSYVNQILDHGGVYKENGETGNPYKIFKDHGTSLVRFRLWHNPAWTKEVYGNDGTQLYNDLKDVERGIRAAKENQMQVLLDFHYSDSWADPGKQEIPKAWQSITSIGVLKDSVYQYTLKTLQYLDAKGLMPELVQIGNETNCGMLYTDAPKNFPACNVCDGQWQQMGEVVNSAITAVRSVASGSSIKTKIILHVADPKNLDWWFGNMAGTGKVSDFDIIGFSYYPIWHTTISLSNLSSTVKSIKNKYQKDIMILETAYPWTTDNNDSYNNIFGSQTPVAGYPFTKQGQFDIMKMIVQEMMKAGGIGVVYWEPAWISSQMKDKWGTGSSWENSAFFDFNGNVIEGIDFMNYEYQK